MLLYVVLAGHGTHFKEVMFKYGAEVVQLMVVHEPLEKIGVISGHGTSYWVGEGKKPIVLLFATGLVIFGCLIQLWRADFDDDDPKLKLLKYYLYLFTKWIRFNDSKLWFLKGTYLEFVIFYLEKLIDSLESFNFDCTGALFLTFCFLLIEVYFAI